METAAPPFQPGPGLSHRFVNLHLNFRRAGSELRLRETGVVLGAFTSVQADWWLSFCFQKSNWFRFLQTKMEFIGCCNVEGREMNAQSNCVWLSLKVQSHAESRIN